MISKDRVLEIEEITDSIIGECPHSSHFPIPIPLKEITNSMGLGTCSNSFDNTKIAGSYTRSENKIRIQDDLFQRKDKYTLPSIDNLNRKGLFTLAHEFGHAVLHTEETDVLLRKDIESYSGKRPIPELEADSFAASLLMPKRCLERYSDNGVIYQSLDWLSQQFRVSKKSMKIRLKTLGLVLGGHE